MSATTSISWTDATWNVVSGCTRISEGCDHCYIERTPPLRMARRRFDRPGVGGSTGVQLHPDRLDKPIGMRTPKLIFVCSLADLFHADVPDDYIARVWATMALSTRQTFQVLTKRATRMRALLASGDFERAVGAAWATHPRRKPYTVWPGWPLPNVWGGVSAETQEWADRRIPELLAAPLAVRWVSAEPLLGPLDLTGTRQSLDWVVCGGESGPKARPMQPEWARSLRDQCVEAGVPFHFKQWGEWGPPPAERSPSAPGAQRMQKVGKLAAGRILDGETHDAYPAPRSAA